MLNAIKSIIFSCFSDTKYPTKISSKRIAAFTLVMLLSAVVIGNMFFGKTIDEFIYTGLSEAVIWSLGFVGAEKFSDAFNRGKPRPDITRPKRYVDDEMS